MPSLGGIDATIQINDFILHFNQNQEQHLPKIKQPIIMAMTAATTDQDKIQCKIAGMHGHVSKPIKIHKISEILNIVQECHLLL